MKFFFFKDRKVRKKHVTKYEEIEARVWNKFINKKSFIASFQTKTEQPNEIAVLKFGNQSDLVLEFQVPLARTLQQPFYSYHLSVWKPSLSMTSNT